MEISEENLLRKFGGDVAVIVPYATFGACLDLDRYTSLARRYDIPVVVDAAASLGTLDKDGVGFGSGFDESLSCTRSTPRSRSPPRKLVSFTVLIRQLRSEFARCRTLGLANRAMRQWLALMES